MSTFPPIADYGFLSNCEQSCLVAPGVTTRRLTAFNGWLRANGNKILIGVLLVGGAILVGNGIYGLIVVK